MQETPVPVSRRSAGEGLGNHSSILGLPWWLRGKRILLDCGRPRLDPRVGKIPWRRERPSGSADTLWSEMCDWKDTPNNPGHYGFRAGWTRGNFACMHAKPLQLCLTLCDPMGCSPLGSRESLHVFTLSHFSHV